MYLKPLQLPKPCILVLEEDIARRAGLCSLLLDAGYDLADCTRGAAATGRTDLVLAPIGTQRRSQAALHLLDPAVPVIALVDRVAWTGFDFFDAANELGAVAVLQRPYSRSALLRLIAATLSGETAMTEDTAYVAPVPRLEDPDQA